MENYNATKERLRPFFDKYNSTETKTNDPNASTVERLKHVATIGFEATEAHSIITSFAAENEFHSNEATSSLMRKLQRQHPFLDMFIGPALQASIAVDLLVSLTNSYEMCFHIFNMLTKLWADPNWCNDSSMPFGYVKFSKNICDCLLLYKSIGDDNFGVRELFYNECYELVPLQLKSKLDRERTMRGIQLLASNDIDTVAKWKALLKPMESIGGGDINYFQRCYHFIVNLVKLLQIQAKSQIALSPLELIRTDLTAVIGEIVFVNKQWPNDIVEIVENLNVNFLYVLCLNMMPAIACAEPNDCAVIDRLIENLSNGNADGPACPNEPRQFYRLNADVLSFLKKNNFLVAYLHQKYHGMADETAVNERKYLNNCMALDDVKTTAPLHGDNLLLSALSYDTLDVNKLESYLLDEANSRNGVRIIQHCSERSQRIKGGRLKDLQDALVTKLLQNGCDNCDLIEQIHGVNAKAEHLLANLLSIGSSETAKRLIQSILQHKNVSTLEESLNCRLHEWWHNIRIYDDVADRMACSNWLEAREMSTDSMETVLKCLLKANEFDLCLAWLKIHPLTSCPAKFDEFLDIFGEIFSAVAGFSCLIFKIVETLPPDIVLQFYDNLLTGLRILEPLEYLTDFLISHSTRPSAYQRYRISLKIFSRLSDDEQETNWPLFNAPLMIVEQFLMNSRHEAMSTILDAIKPILNDEPCKYCYARQNSSYDAKSSSDPDFKVSLLENDFGQGDHSLSIHCIDSLLKVYASKALDFRVSETHSHSSNELLTHSIASLDSLCGSFVMPKVAPDRLHWVKDEDTGHCQCCRRSAFTMLCRRHHCRRCGRVVCHACSTKRIQIPELYCDVQVRSCDDCYKQMQIQANQKKTPNAGNGAISDDMGVWQFSGNKKHDVLLREEFCFEYAPSVSLCLSILQFYSSDKDCVNFLLHHCHRFESLLRPLQPGYPNPEIDYALVTRMMHCLALAAKVRGSPPSSSSDVKSNHPFPNLSMIGPRRSTRMRHDSRPRRNYPVHRSARL